MNLKKRIEEWKVDRDCSKWLKMYWRLHNAGQTTKELEEVVDKIMQARIENAFLKKQNKALKAKIRKNWHKVFWVNHIMGFVFSDTGHIFCRGRLSQCLVAWVKVNLALWWGMFLGWFNPYQDGVRSYFCLYAGVKSASRHTGYSEDLLLKREDEILG